MLPLHLLLLNLIYDISMVIPWNVDEEQIAKPTLGNKGIRSFMVWFGPISVCDIALYVIMFYWLLPATLAALMLP